MRRPLPALRRPLLALLAVGIATATTAGCGSGPSKPSQAAIEAKLKSESELQSFSAGQIACAAGVVRQYGDASSLNSYIAGRITADQLQGSNRKIVQTKLNACFHNGE